MSLYQIQSVLHNSILILERFYKTIYFLHIIIEQSKITGGSEGGEKAGTVKSQSCFNILSLAVSTEKVTEKLKNWVGSLIQNTPQAAIFMNSSQAPRQTKITASLTFWALVTELLTATT